MCADNELLSCSALLRVAGLPVRYWLAGANPMLFDKVARLECDEEARRECAAHLAERIGQRLIPHPALSRADRALLLAVRRSLHRGDLIAKASRERLFAVSGLIGDEAELVQALVALVDRDRALAALAAEIEADLAQEQDRLSILPEKIAHESAIAKAVLARQEPVDSAFGQHLSQKSRRHRNEHEWRCIARAATGSTPRGWLSHVALLPIEPAVWLPPTVTDHLSAQWIENIRERRLALADPPDDWPVADSRLALNPLRWDADGRLVSVMADENRQQTQVSVHRSPLLDVICTTLADAIHTFEELARALGCENQDEWLALGGFVRHLVVLGIVQPSAPPLVYLERRANPGKINVHVGDAACAQSGWLDVYRYTETGLSQDLGRELQAGVTHVLRVLALMRSSLPALTPRSVVSSERSWSVTEILRAQLEASESASADIDEEIFADGSCPQASSTTGFARLLATLGERAEHVDENVIDAVLLDQCGARSDVLDWPIDGLVRVPVKGAGYVAVLDALWPPGMLDARFVDALVDLHQIVPHVEAYRAFLHHVEQLTEIQFVEVLAPPLQSGAANAVRRPVYTRAWTGDPDFAAYLRADQAPGRHIPLRAIRIRRINGRLRAEVDGQTIWPIYHATRSFSPPWDQLARILLATAPLETPWDYQSMIRSLTQLPEQSKTPRLSVGGGIVISPARWRLSPELLWDRNVTCVAKLRALVRLQSRHALPRWIQLDRGADLPPVPCDLESVHAIRTIERCATGNATLSVSEMLPTPDHILVRDRAHRDGDRLASQIQLRFPCDESAVAMAARVAPAVLAALGKSASVLAPSGCRGPPARQGGL